MVRTALRANPTRQRVSIAGTIPAPVKGWMALDSLAAMPEDSAVKLVNWFPTPTDIALRRGSQMWAEDIAGPVTTLMVWNGPSDQKLFAVGGGKIWDVTSQSFNDDTLWDVFPGALAAGTGWDVPPEATPTLWDAVPDDNKVDTGVVSLDDWWQWENFSNSGGNFLIAVNGAQVRRLYNGTAWTTSPAITGVDSAKLINVFAHKRRIWFIEKDSTRAWYLDTDAIGGAATVFDLGPQMTGGGHLVAGGAWTIDGGFGPDDYAFFLTSEGQVLAYAGNNPSDANNWGIKGTWQIGRPLGYRCLLKAGADIAITCEDGVVSLAKSLTLDRSSSLTAAITRNIQAAFNDAVRANGTLRGWQVLSYPVGTMAIVNVPTAPNAASVQYVMNTITGAWCEFQGMNAACWALMDGKAYFGTWDGEVGISDAGVSDVGSDSMSADVVTAFNYLRPKAQQKQIKMLRPVIQGDTTVAPAVDVSTDYDIRKPQGVISAAIPNGPRWDFALWDQAVWQDEIPVVRLEWTTVFGLGYTFAATMNVTVSPPLGRNNLIDGIDVRVVSFDTIYEPGALM